MAYSLGIAAGAWAWSRYVYRNQKAHSEFWSGAFAGLAGIGQGAILNRFAQELRKQLVRL